MQWQIISSSPRHAQFYLACLAMLTVGGTQLASPAALCRTVAWNMSLETTLSSAAVARGFASYLATLFGLSPSSLRIDLGAIQLDPAAALLVLFLTALLIKGTKESSLFNMVGGWVGGSGVAQAGSAACLFVGVVSAARPAATREHKMAT